MLWLLRRGVAGYVQNATASVFTLIYIPFLGSFVALLLAEDEGAKAVITFIRVTVASDIGGYAAGVLFGKHPMAPVISPKKSWEGFAGSAVACVVAGYVLVVYLLDGDWWVGVILGLIAVVMATLGDLCESVWHSRPPGCAVSCEQSARGVLACGLGIREPEERELQQVVVVRLDAVGGHPSVGQERHPHVVHVVVQNPAVRIMRRPVAVVVHDVGEHGERGLPRHGGRVAAALQQLRPGLEEGRHVVGWMSGVELVLELVDEERVEGRVAVAVDLHERAVAAHTRGAPEADLRAGAEHLVWHLERHAEDVLARERVVAGELEVVERAFAVGEERIAADADEQPARTASTGCAISSKPTSVPSISTSPAGSGSRAWLPVS